MDNNQLGERIKARMKARGVTQQELADMVGVGQSQISRILKGERGTDIETVKRIATALGESQQEYVNLFAGIKNTVRDRITQRIMEKIADWDDESKL